MKTIEEFQVLEKGETIDDLSLDMILGGRIAQSDAAGDCDHCNTCGNGGNNSHNGSDLESSVSMG